MEKPQKRQFKVDLVQPNKVTMARYDYTACQENVLTCMIGAIQDHMTRKKPIETDLFGNPTITISASEIAKGNTKHYVISQIKKLRTKEIDFEWTNENGENEDVNTILVGAIRTINDSDHIKIEINKWAIPYLVYWGKGVGGTIFSKSLALTLKSIYAKRIYKLLKQWENKGGTPPLEINDFRAMMGIESKYPRPALISKYVLDPAKKEVDGCGDVTFEYSFSKIKSRSYNYLNIKIFGTKRQEKDNPNKWYRMTYAYLCRAWPSYTNDKSQTIADELSNKKLIKSFYDRMIRLDDELTSGKLKGMDHFVATMKKILKEDFEVVL